jgi:hypothetical protein
MEVPDTHVVVMDGALGDDDCGPEPSDRRHRACAPVRVLLPLFIIRYLIAPPISPFVAFYQLNARAREYEATAPKI